MIKVPLKRKIAFLLGLTFHIVPDLGLAQEGAPILEQSKIVRKNLAPVSDEILRVRLPKAVVTQLKNGLTVLILEDDRQPIVSAQLIISGAGPLYEPTELVGIAGITATMLRDGTTTRSKRQIRVEIARLGATLSSSSNFGSSAAFISSSGLSRNIEDWLEVMADILLRPIFPQEELDQLRERSRIRLQQQRTSSNFLARERFNKAVFGEHPASAVSQTEESLDRMKVELITKWHQERYAPQNAILGIAGDVDSKEIVPKLDELFEEWERTEATENLPLPPKPTEARKVYLVDRPNSTQTTLIMGNIAVDRKDSDYIPLTVMNGVLGGSAAARLFINLREEKGYTYGAYSGFSALKYPGAWNASADVRTEVTSGAMDEFLAEIERIQLEIVSETELDEVKRSIVAGFALSLEQPASLLRYSTIREIYEFSRDYWDQYPTQIMAVTAEDVKQVAKKYLNPDGLQIVAVGDASEIKALMHKYGPVVMYDTDGNLVTDP